MADQITTEYLTPQQAAEFLGVSIHWVLEHARGRYEPVLPGFKLGKLWKFKVVELEGFRRKYHNARAFAI